MPKKQLKNKNEISETGDILRLINYIVTSVQDKFTKQAPVATSKQEVSPVAAEEQKQTIRTNPFVQTNTL